MIEAQKQEINTIKDELEILIKKKIIVRNYCCCNNIDQKSTDNLQKLLIQCIQNNEANIQYTDYINEYKINEIERNKIENEIKEKWEKGKRKRQLVKLLILCIILILSGLIMSIAVILSR